MVLKLRSNTCRNLASRKNMIPNSLSQMEQSYSILIETPKTGGYKATALGLPNCQVKGATRDIALENIKQLLTTRLNQSEIVTLKISSPQSEHPWMQFAGMFQHDPQLKEVLADIQAYREEIESEGAK
jgi:predicted RNase H-like HicB family nuclease